MFLKNYTSEVALSITIQRIVNLLVAVGVANISMDYAPDGRIVGITFRANIDGRPIPIRIPVDVDACWEAFWKDYCGTDPARLLSDRSDEYCSNARKSKSKSAFKAQAERTAWRLMQDWLEVQISLVQLKQAELMQVFLPYAWDGRQTFYKAVKSGGFAALMPPRDEPGRVEFVQ